MGLDFLRAKSERFVQKRDDSKGKELDTVDLINRSKPDHFVRLFRCQLTDASATLLTGTGAIARVMIDGQVVIVQSAKTIGYVISPDATELTEAMHRNHRYGGVLSVIVVQEPDFNGEFAVRSKSPLK
jgi:hypothetical protein